jgi:hypothetical protein
VEAVGGQQGPHSESRGQPPAEVGDPPARVEERPVECDTRIPRSRRRIAVEDDQTGEKSPYSISPWSPRGESLSQTEKAEALADSLETQVQPVTDPSVPAVTEVIDVALRSYFMTPASELLKRWVY